MNSILVQDQQALQQLADGDEAKLIRYLLRRGYGEPMAYIRGYKDFPYGDGEKIIRTKMDPRAYVTNIESLGLVEEVAKMLKQGGSVLEVGLGSGTLSIVLQKLRSDITKHFACDLSPHALRLAQENIDTYGLAIQIFESNACRDLDIPAPDIIFADMPYGGDEYVLETSDLSDFKHMPQCALFDFRGPMHSYLEIVKSAQAKGWKSTILCEIGIMSKEDVAPHLPKDLFRHIKHNENYDYNILIIHP